MTRVRTVIIAASAAVACIVSGCGDNDNTVPAAATATLPSSPTNTQRPTSTVTVPPTLTATATSVPTATSTSSPTASATSSATASATSSPTETATATSSSTATETPTATFTATITETPTITVTPTITDSPTVTLTPSITPTETVTETPSLSPTVTETPTPTPSATATNTLGVLGTRHFVLDKNKSTFQVKVAGGLTIPLGGFQGQTNNQVEAAFIDFEVGQPDEDGFAIINIPRTSDFIFVDATALAQFVICVKPLVPVMRAGIVGCNGGIDISLALDVDHHLGELGVGGFTLDQCRAKNGNVEIPYAACSAGKVGQVCDTNPDCNSAPGTNDGVCAHVPAQCTVGNFGAVCQKDTDCDDEDGPGHCGMPHPGVCNGPLVPGLGTGDTGPGAVFIVPNPAPDAQLNGMPIRLIFEQALPCGDEGPGFISPFALTTAHSSSTVLNANNELGHSLTFDATGENFSCQDWQTSTRGRLVLSAPALDQNLVGDVATIFNFASH